MAATEVGANNAGPAAGSIRTLHCFTLARPASHLLMPTLRRLVLNRPTLPSPAPLTVIVIWIKLEVKGRLVSAGSSGSHWMSYLLRRVKAARPGTACSTAVA